MSVDLIVTGFALAGIAFLALGFGLGFSAAFLGLYWISKATDSAERLLDKAQVAAAAARVESRASVSSGPLGRVGKC